MDEVNRVREFARWLDDHGGAVLGASPFAIVGVDHERRIAAWTGQASAIFGISGEAALGQPLAEVLAVAVSGGDGGEGDGWDTIWAGEPAGPQLLWHPDATSGERRAVEWTAQPLAELGGTLLYGQDVTDREARQIERMVLGAIVENVAITAWAVDSEGNFTYNRGLAGERLGIPNDSLLGTNIFAAYASNDEGVRRAFAGELVHNHAFEHGVHWESWLVPVRDDAGEVVGVVGTSLDITEARQREQELRDKLAIIERQQQAIRELSTPIIEVWDRVISLPVIGLVDSTRAAELMDKLLEAVVHHQARFAILDLTGVDVVDTGTASHLLRLIRAVGLLGAEGVISGIHPNIAQTIVELGIDLSGLRVHSSLREALQACIVTLGRDRARRRSIQPTQ